MRVHGVSSPDSVPTSPPPDRPDDPVDVLPALISAPLAALALVLAPASAALPTESAPVPRAICSSSLVASPFHGRDRSAGDPRRGQGQDDPHGAVGDFAKRRDLFLKLVRESPAFLREAAAEALKSKELIDAFAAVGGIVGGGSSEDFALFQREDVAKWAEVIKAANVKLE